MSVEHSNSRKKMILVEKEIVSLCRGIRTLILFCFPMLLAATDLSLDPAAATDPLDVLLLVFVVVVVVVVVMD